jgi:hypothetical protein
VQQPVCKRIVVDYLFSLFDFKTVGEANVRSSYNLQMLRWWKEEGECYYAEILCVLMRLYQKITKTKLCYLVTHYKIRMALLTFLLPTNLIVQVIQIYDFFLNLSLI